MAKGQDIALAVAGMELDKARQALDDAWVALGRASCEFEAQLLEHPELIMLEVEVDKAHQHTSDAAIITSRVQAACRGLIKAHNGGK